MFREIRLPAVYAVELAALPAEFLISGNPRDVQANEYGYGQDDSTDAHSEDLIAAARLRRSLRLRDRLPEPTQAVGAEAQPQIDLPARCGTARL